MNALRELYQEIILDHYRRPRNFGPLDGANREAAGHNPLCGDQVKVHLKVGPGETRRRQPISKAPAAPSRPPRPR